jgi:hypothetical protein
MANRTDEIDPGWLFDDFIEISLRHLPDGMWELDYKTSAERAVIMDALERVAADLPRAPETTDEQHQYDAFIELSRRHHAHGAGLPTMTAGADLTSSAMASIRDADESASRARRERTPRKSDAPVDPKLRATTEMILAMPVDDRLRQIEAESSFFSSIRPVDS